MSLACHLWVIPRVQAAHPTRAARRQGSVTTGIHGSQNRAVVHHVSQDPGRVNQARNSAIFRTTRLRLSRRAGVEVAGFQGDSLSSHVVRIVRTSRGHLLRILAGSLMPRMPDKARSHIDTPSATLLLAWVLFASAGCRAPDPAPPSPRLPSDTLALARVPGGAHVEVAVRSVVDGDTIRVTGLPTGTELVRLIGIDAPETGEGRTTRECFGREAQRWLADQVPRGSRLRLVFDVGQRDRYGRLLAYAHRPDGTFLNAELVARGYAQTMTIPPNVRHAKELRELQRRARAEDRGLWSACRGNQ